MISTIDLIDHLPNHPVIIEAGAHDGRDTVAMARFAEHVWAFEPVPALYEQAREAVSIYGNISLSPLALGEFEQMRKMWLSGGGPGCDGSSSLMAPAEHYGSYPQIHFEPEPIKVPVTTIQAWAQSSEVDHIDGAWLDMQGSELAALKSAGPILDTLRAVMLEVSLIELYAGCPLWPEVREWLEDHGFTVVIEDLYSPHAGDALVVRS
jgi:FkbM family methyltransferase